MKRLITFAEKARIDEICKKYNIFPYTLTSDGLVDVPDDVNLANRKLTKIPLNFGTVGGSFYCHINNLTSLKGSPKFVGGDFIAYRNKLKNLVGAPEVIVGYLDCSNNATLTSTYSGDTDIDLGSGENITRPIYILNDLPEIFDDNTQHIRIILKYQRHYMIWNDDLSLNLDNFNDLIADIKDGLE